MRKLLVEQGLVGEDGPRLCDNRVTFPAANAKAFLERLSDAMGLPEVRRHLNVPRISADLLHRAGLLKPLYGASFPGKHRLTFARADVDAFLGRLLLDAEEMDDEVEGALAIAQAAHACFCNSMDIVRMVLGRELPWVGRRSGERGYLSVRVRLDDVRERIDACCEGVSVAKAAQGVRVPIHVLRNLIRHGMIRTGDDAAATGRKTRFIIPRSSLRDFRDRYAALGEIAWEWDCTEDQAETRLLKFGFAPALPQRKVGACFFRRSEIRRLRDRTPAAPID